MITLRRSKNAAANSRMRGWCDSHPESVRNLHDPDHMRHVVEVMNDLHNPYSGINMARWAAELEQKMINTAPSYRYLIRDPESGEVIDEERYYNHVDPSSLEARIYVAELN